VVRLIDHNGTPHDVEDDIVDLSSSDFSSLVPGWLIVACSCGNNYHIMASNESTLFNPMNSSHNIAGRDKMRKKRCWSMQRCSKECFDNYVQFLRSKNRTPYLIAERRFSYESK